MQSFIDNERQEPEKRDVSRRTRSFEEIYRFFTRRQAAQQAERCVQCGDPFCTTLGCPLNNAIPQWLEAIAEKDLEKAFRLSNETSPFPEILGRICPHNRVCEGACTLEDGYGAITIGAIEASITDLGLKAGYRLPFPGVRSDKKVAVVGSGPAGFSCAHFLLRAGIGVDMYERSELPGGLLSYGIPGFKLGKELIARRFGILRAAGLGLHLGKEVGTDLPLNGLLDKYDAVFLGLGATYGKRAGIENEDHEQVFLAMEYLSNVQRRLYGQPWMEGFAVGGKRVVVVGGGDTAMDCVRTAVREGAESVTCLYRRDEANMPGSAKEFHNAVEEGVVFLFNEAPARIDLDAGGALVGLDAVRTRLGEPGPDGRQKVFDVEGGEHCVPADVVIMALGFDTGATRYLRDAGVELGKWGQVVIDPATGRTAKDRVYAGGDCYRGADLVVTAAADGRRAALAIMETLLGGGGED
ncbi:glutamate synthase subunit beta [uncultured Desulfuromonas sp.]|uniref:glutamate synthase subunit beta n=1 Tax=uncultured Desulfuromonas sp. TaxID=181013 RepID=UPI00261D637C|nr:glutamate synthase subunit beta [uncultured Desulfuromonas sp.]